MTALSSSDPEGRVGSLIAGKYRLKGILGQGAMGVVYRGEDQLTRGSVAVKMLHEHVADDAMTRQRLLREAQAAARLRHPNVVDVLDVGEDGGVVYLVLEVLEGESLEDRLMRSAKMSPREAFSLILPILEALAWAHEMGVLHRDIKPDNIFLHETGGRVVPKLLDFGIAKHLDRRDGLKTAAGTVLGTPAYMSPEQASGDDVSDPATDVWSAGVVLFECLTGGLPFEGKTRVALMFAVISEEAPPLSTRAPELPPGLAAAIDRALRPEIGDRYATMGEMVSALRRALDDAGVEVDEPGEVGGSLLPAPPLALEDRGARHPRLPMVIGVGLALALALGVFLTG